MNVSLDLFQGYRNTNAYIITQWPLRSTINDIWRLVYDYNIPTIVLLNDINGSRVRYLACILSPLWTIKVGLLLYITVVLYSLSSYTTHGLSKIICYSHQNLQLLTMDV